MDCNCECCKQRRAENLAALRIECDELHERLAKADARIRELTEERDELRERAEEFERQRDDARTTANHNLEAFFQAQASSGDVETPVRAFYAGKRAGYDEAYARLLEIEKEVAELKEKLVEAE